LDRDAGPSVPAAEEVPVPEFTDADPNGCDSSVADPNRCDPSVADPNGCDPSVANPNGCAVCVADENEGEEENEVPLTQKNSWQYVASGESSGVPSPALSALIGLQELSLANFDQTLEDMVPEDLLSEPADVTRWMFVLMCSTPGWGHPGQRPAPHQPWSVVLRVRKLTWIVLLSWK
jgi:hypothetical protein